MNIQSIYLGASANDNTGNTLRAGGFKINDNFVELFTFGPARHRQSLLIYKTLSSGAANFLEYTGLNVNLIAPLVCTIAAGYEQRGERNSSIVLTTDQLSAWTLPTSGVSYLYIEQVGLSSSPTFGYSTLAPYRAQVSAVSPVSGQHWFNTLANQMYAWDGFDFDPVNRIFVGYIQTSASSVVSVNYYTGNDETDYVDYAVLSGVNLSKAYTDLALISAKAYTDLALISAANYTNLQTSATLVSAQNYANNAAKKYALILG